MRLLALLGLIFLLIVPIYSQEENSSDDAPYIYYYSNVLKGIVIERADGTDSRIIGQNLMPDVADFIEGPGWSPDGQWFAYTRKRHGGFAVSTNDKPLTMLADFPIPIEKMLWHPTENLLLVYGWGGDDISQTRIATYWLIDVDAQSLLVSMSIESYPETGPIVYWFDDHVAFYETPWSFDRFYLVKMYFDGDVIIDQISRDEWGSTLPEGQRDARVSGLEADYAYPSFTHRYSFTGTTELPFTVPQNSSAAGQYVSWEWDHYKEWLFIGYEWCYADCSGVTGRVSIYNPTTEQYRELSDCGSSHACVGWLPERVNVEELPEGQSKSLLIQPAYYYDVDLADYIGPIVNNAGQHTLDCNTDSTPYLRELVRNKRTSEIEFILPFAEPCEEPIEDINYESQYWVVFTLSPDENYFAITNNTFTSVYEVETGELITTLNIFGAYLWFSDDSQTLFTSGNFRGAAWDMKTLIADRSR